MNTTQEYWFKVVKKSSEPDVFVSGIVDQRSKCCLRYKIGEKTVPFIGKIFIFETLLHSKRFIYDNFLLSTHIDIVLLKVKCEDEYPTKMDDYSLVASENYIMRFWKVINSKDYEYWVKNAPPLGTYGATSITPVKIVDF
jgi:hypothetical protein